jgi:hypothetical protein
MKSRLQLTIADFHIHLFADFSLLADEGHQPFISTSDTNTADIKIDCHPIGALPFSTDNIAFEAANDTQLFYRIYTIETGLGFIIYNQQTNEVQQYATLSADFTQWNIWSELLPENTLDPLRYPMGPIMMHYMTMKYNAVMMHASCTFDGEKGRMFSGFSGVGKSTMSRIWAETGSQIINDDRLILREQNGKIRVYNTPMYYCDKPKSTVLDGIFLISHSPENKINQLSGAMAMSKVMAFSIQNNFDKQFIASRLDLFSRICSLVPVFELGFVPDQSVISFIRENERK